MCPKLNMEELSPKHYITSYRTVNYTRTISLDINLPTVSFRNLDLR